MQKILFAHRLRLRHHLKKVNLYKTELEINSMTSFFGIMQNNLFELVNVRHLMFV